MKKVIDTKELAFLSKLSFSDTELSAFQQDMENIQSFFESVSTCCEDDLSDFTQGQGSLREDIPKAFEEGEMLLSVSRSAEAEGYKVRKVVEG